MSDAVGPKTAKKLRHLDNPSTYTSVPRTTQVGGLVTTEHTLTRGEYFRLQALRDEAAGKGGGDVGDT